MKELEFPKPYFPRTLKRFLILFVWSLFISDAINAQSYFQQKVDYLIKVKLDDRNHTLSAFEEITYQNNSAVSLKEIWFHLWPNGYKNNQTAFAKQELSNGDTKFQFANESDRGFIDSLNFIVNGNPVSMEMDPKNPDIARIILNEPIEPGKSIVIATPFRVKIPSSKFSRLGHDGQQYQITQWFPKPAVYDVKGWHAMPYLNTGEFYAEFGSFEVHITTPENYVIAATGKMQENPEEEARVQQRVLETISYLKSNQQKNIRPDSIPPSSQRMKTVVYRQDQVHDFAWFADKRYHILEDEFTLEASGKVIHTYAYFTDQNAQAWEKATEFTSDAIKHYSKWIGEYPYDVCKVVDGALSAGGGMEYPTITVISFPGNIQTLDRVIAHEVGHNWFYGILGSNERDDPWMDEGINSYYERRYMQLKYPDSKPLAELNMKGIRKLARLDDFNTNQIAQVSNLFLARRNEDIPVSAPAPSFSEMAYGLLVYEKSALLLKYLALYLGQNRFDQAMQKYFQEWKFKHPDPKDFRTIMENETGSNLSWWFDDLLSSRKRLDYAITKIRNKRDSSIITIKNKGQIASPFLLTSFRSDNTFSSEWMDGFDENKKRYTVPNNLVEKFSINGSYLMPDFNPRNDAINTSGLFKKIRKPVLRFGTGLENPKYAQLYFYPAIGYNAYDGFMAGLGIHNIGVLRKKFEFLIMPMYGFNNVGNTNFPEDKIAGSAQVDYLIRPVNSFFKTITLSATAERYAMGIAPTYERVTWGANMLLHNRTPASKIRKEIIFRQVLVGFKPYQSDSLPIIEKNYTYNQLLLSFTDRRKFNPYGAILDIQQSFSFLKASATIYHFFSYSAPKKGLSLRLFAGTFLSKPTGNFSGPDARFRLSGQNGSQDYLFNDVFLGRNMTKGIWSQQMTETDGGFKVYSFKGQTWNSLLALNLKTTLPGKIPIRLFADIGFYKNEELDKDKINYDAGAYIAIIPEAFEVYFPFLISPKIKDNIDLITKNYGERIRFVLNLKLANPISIFRNFQL